MKIQQYYVHKPEVKYITEDFTVEKTKEYLEKVGLGAVPVLTKNTHKFLGNIYETQVLKYHGDMKENILPLVCDSEAVIYENDSFRHCFFSMKRLPYLAVLNEKEEFVGILTHAIAMTILEDAFGFPSRGVSLSIGTIDYSNVISILSAIIGKYSSIKSMLTHGSKDSVRLISVTLAKEISDDDLKKMIEEIESKGCKVVTIDKDF